MHITLSVLSEPACGRQVRIKHPADGMRSRHYIAMGIWSSHLLTFYNKFYCLFNWVLNNILFLLRCCDKYLQFSFDLFIIKCSSSMVINNAFFNPLTNGLFLTINLNQNCYSKSASLPCQQTHSPYQNLSNGGLSPFKQLQLKKWQILKQFIF